MSGSQIGYISSSIPSLEPPPYRGEWYDDEVPDTLDISERAALAINGLTGPMDPEMDHELYFMVQFLRNPPMMAHSSSDWCGTKFWEALPLLRMACGSNLNDYIDPIWMQVVLRSIGPDGLFYVPVTGRPWQDPKCEWSDVVYAPGGSAVPVNDEAVTQCAHAQPSSRVLGVMSLYYLRDQNPLWKATCEGMIDRLMQLVVDKGDYAFFPAAAYEPGAKADPRAPMPVGTVGEEVNGRLPQGLTQYYRISGYEPALTLARKLTNYLRYHSQYFGEDGRFIWDERFDADYSGPHFHAHTIALLGILEYAVSADDRELLEWTKNSYEWAKSHPSSCSLVGFFPEIMDARYPASESCEVADMIALALKLSEAGVGDYWDDADRWSRNQFAESQLTRIDWVERSVTELPHQPIPDFATSERVAERNLGAFAGWPAPNDWQIESWSSIMHCCTGNAARAIYYIWEHILDCRNERLKVNLLLNRASPWADIYSHIPYQGRVDVKVKSPCREILIHMPEWVGDKDQNVASTVNGGACSFHWRGRCLSLEGLKPGDVVTVFFPIEERTMQVTIAGRPYNLVLKGNTVVSIDPPGKYCPSYQRSHYRKSKTRWRQVRRFVSAENVPW